MALNFESSLSRRQLKIVRKQVKINREYWVSVFWNQVHQARLQERLLNQEACRGLEHAFSKVSLVKLILKDVNLGEACRVIQHAFSKASLVN